MRTQQEPIAQRTALLVRDHQRVLRVACRMAGRKVHALEVVEVRFDFRTNADGVAQSREDTGNFVQRTGDGMLGSRKATRTWQSNVDCLASKRSVIRTGAFGRFAQLLDEFFERFETLADSFLRFWRRAFEPAA